MSHQVAAFYQFTALPDFRELREPLRAICAELQLRGSVLLAHEGINGTVAGSEADIAALIDHLESIEGLAGLEVKYSSAAQMPFHRMKVRLKREIVTMGVENIDPHEGAGAYVEPRNWNALIADPETIVIDTRNDYEVSLGTFERALNPKTASFRDFPDWVGQHRDEFEGKKIAMFCTGGIRCEKATAYMISLGFPDVFHLKGGILKYLEDVPAKESLWQGECFVFDERVSVSHGLEVGEAELCRACRHPLTPADRQSEHFREGISCERCFDTRTEADRARYAERQRQVELSVLRGEKQHIGR